MGWRPTQLRATSQNTPAWINTMSNGVSADHNAAESSRVGEPRDDHDDGYRGEGPSRDQFARAEAQILAA